MSTETQKVDVLAVIADAIKRTSPTTHFNERANLWVAHDAVAELIGLVKANEKDAFAVWNYLHAMHASEPSRDLATAMCKARKVYDALISVGGAA